MSLVDVKARIAAKLAEVSDIGNVFTRLPYAKDSEQVNALLIGEKGRVHVWGIRRESYTQGDETQNQSYQTRRSVLVLHGFYAVEDSQDTEAKFDALIDAVIAKLNDDRQPAGAGGTKLNSSVGSADPPYLRLLDEREYAGTLCHHCEIPIVVEEDIQ